MKDEKILKVHAPAVDICAPLQREFYECRNFRQEKRLIKKILRQKKPSGFFSTPAPVRFSWEPKDSEVVLEISENSDFSDSLTVCAENGEAAVYNLKKNTKYFSRIDGGEVSTFVTDNVLPRWIYAEGYENIRDFGGEKTKSGKTVKQGLLYRGVRLEGKVSAAGIEALRKLGIKTDLDLRKEALGKVASSPLGEDVGFILYPCDGYEEFLEKYDRQKIKELIGFFADESLYPVYFHCHGGQDRTGTIGFMLGAILGLDDETLIREYELTMITYPDKKLSRSRKDKIKEFLEILQKKDKSKTLGENAVDFLKECGVSGETMEKIRKILL